jgi:hypothetical protein
VESVSISLPERYRISLKSSLLNEGLISSSNAMVPATFAVAPEVPPKPLR